METLCLAFLSSYPIIYNYYAIDVVHIDDLLSSGRKLLLKVATGKIVFGLQFSSWTQLVSLILAKAFGSEYIYCVSNIFLVCLAWGLCID